uniref:Uncharacterized protein n=1 Tax=Arundo donax TaxID=35708 RepID=A0A0A9AVI5_ARUDO
MHKMGAKLVHFLNRQHQYRTSKVSVGSVLRFKARHH